MTAGPDTGEGTGATGLSPDASLRPSWVTGAVVTVLFLAVFFPFLERRAIFYSEQPLYSHCLLIPLVSAVWVYEHWDRLTSLPRAPSRAGLGLLGFSLLLYLVGRLGSINIVMHAGFLLGVVGLVWGLAGRKVLAAAAFPVGYLALTVPLPKPWDLAIVQPLQRIATILSESFFDALGWVVVRQGNVLQLPGLKLLVEEQCSGIHSLYALVALGVAWGFFMQRPAWLKVTLVVATVPIAILANAVRVSGTGVLAYKVDTAYAEGLSHQTAGMIVFAIGLGLLLVVDWCLKPDPPGPADERG